MKKAIALSITSLLLLSFLGSYTTNVKADTETETASASEQNEDGYSDEDVASIVDEHTELIGYLIAKDYSAAEEYIHNLAVEEEQGQAGDIEDYLVEVELTQANLFDYFEFVTIPFLDEFGDETGYVGDILKSKEYDNGLLIYKMDNMPLEYTSTYGGESHTTDLFSILDGDAVTINNMAITTPGVLRMKSGSITYIKSEYVLSYSEEEVEHYPSLSKQHIELKNGEIIDRTIINGYPY